MRCWALAHSDALDDTIDRMQLETKSNRVFLIQYKHRYCISTHSYEHMYMHSTPISIFKRLNWFDLEIHEINYKSVLLLTGTALPTERIISRKYNIYVKSRILSWMD
jgi:hypothetical protein